MPRPREQNSRGGEASGGGPAALGLRLPRGCPHSRVLLLWSCLRVSPGSPTDHSLLAAPPTGVLPSHRASTGLPRLLALPGAPHPQGRHRYQGWAPSQPGHWPLVHQPLHLEPKAEGRRRPGLTPGAALSRRKPLLSSGCPVPPLHARVFSLPQALRTPHPTTYRLRSYFQL